MENTLSLNHENISPTAKMVAHLRQFTDIPYSKDVAELFHTEESMQKMFRDFSGAIPKDHSLIPMLEIRYKSIQILLEKLEIKQILELASGISLRGLSMTEDPELTYIETDLATLTREKQKLVSLIMDRHNVVKRDNLFIGEANVLYYSEVEKFLKYFKEDKPVAVVHEGLYQYLSKKEKSEVARNIHKILSRFGGVWITPDLDSKAQLNKGAFSKENYQKFIDVIAETTGRDFMENAFTDDAEIENFMDQHGFNLEIHPQIAGDVSLSSLPGPEHSESVYRTLKSLRLWVMRCKKS